MDLLSILLIGNSDDFTQTAGDSAILKLLKSSRVAKMMRLLKFCKVFRILKQSVLFDRLDEFISTPSQQVADAANNC